LSGTLYSKDLGAVVKSAALAALYQMMLTAECILKSGFRILERARTNFRQAPGSLAAVAEDGQTGQRRDSAASAVLP